MISKRKFIKEVEGQDIKFSDSTSFSRKIIVTEDGSHSLFVPHLNETYHSIHGSYQEAKHIFINDALSFVAASKQSLNVLEIGFGTGLNAFLTLLFAEENNHEIYYQGIEKYPVVEQEYLQLNYSENNPGNQELFLKLHRADWDDNISINTSFILRKEQVDFRKMTLAKDFFDVVYFDAFGPDVQPELWKEEVFQLIFNSMKRGGVMTTYSVKGVVRRAMKAVGFEVDKIQGPVGKREITRAIK